MNKLLWVLSLVVAAYAGCILPQNVNHSSAAKDTPAARVIPLDVTVTDTP